MIIHIFLRFQHSHHCLFLHTVLNKDRDPYPKMNLDDGFIGDKVPLCIDLPEKHFLKKGAQFRLLGSSSLPDLHEYGWYWKVDHYKLPRNGFLELDSLSNLRNFLRSKSDIVVTLDSNLICRGDECDVDTVSIIKVQQSPPIYYEYIRPPCVEFPFYSDAKKVSTNGDESMCADPKLNSAFDQCCDNPDHALKYGFQLCLYAFERTTQSTARSRCQSTFENGDICDSHWSRSTERCSTSEGDYMLVSQRTLFVENFMIVSCNLFMITFTTCSTILFRSTKV